MQIMSSAGGTAYKMTVSTRNGCYGRVVNRKNFPGVFLSIKRGICQNAMMICRKSIVGEKNKTKIGNKKRYYFAGQGTNTGEGNGRLFVLGNKIRIQKKYNSYPENLFHNLCSRWDSGFFHSVKEPVEAGMKGSKRKGKGADSKEGSAAFFL